MLVAILLLALNLRAAVTSVPPLLGRISADVGLSTALTGVLGSLPVACFALAGAIGPPLLRRQPAERIILVLTVMIVVGEVFRPWTGSPAAFLAASAVALLAMGLGNVALPAVVKGWFPDRIGAVTGLYVTALTIGTAIPPLLVVPIADAVGRASARGGELGHLGPGWHLALAAWGTLAAVAAVFWIVPARHPRTHPGTDGAVHARIPVYRSRVAWGVMLTFGTTSLNFYAIIAWLPRRLVDAGLSEPAAGAELALVAGMGVPLALGVPLLAARVSRVLPMVIVFAACLAVGYAGLLLAPTTLTWLWAVITGTGAGGFPLALALVGLRSAGPVTAGALSAFTQGLGYAMAGAGPIVVGLLYQGKSGWAGPFVFLGTTLVLLVLGGWFAGGRTTVDEELGLPAAPAHDVDGTAAVVRPTDTLIE